MVSHRPAGLHFALMAFPDETIESLEERRAALEESGESGEPAQYGTTGHVPQPKSVTYIDHDDPFVLVDQASGDPNLRSMTRNGWVCCGDDVYVLECLGKGYIRITPAEGNHDGKQPRPNC